VKVPYCLRVSEEVKIYEKLLISRAHWTERTNARPAPCALLAQFTVLVAPEGAGKLFSMYSKMRVYDGENLKDTDPKAKSVSGIPRLRLASTKAWNGLINTLCVQDPFQACSTSIMRGSRRQPGAPALCSGTGDRAGTVSTGNGRALSAFHQGISGTPLCGFHRQGNSDRLSRILFSEYGQNIFDRYVTYADYWIQDQEYRDTDTGEVFDRSSLNAELEKIEKPAGIANPKDFRNEIVNFVLRARANNQGKNPLWTSYEKLRTVIEKKMFSNTEELLPVISFNAKASADDVKKHEDFVNRMVNKGYTAKQVRLLCEWYLRVRKNS
jgi:serine protein kinase